MKALLKVILGLGTWLFVIAAHAQSGITSSCSMLLEQFRLQYSQEKSGDLFSRCQSCCEETKNDSLLLQLFLADSSTYFVNPRFSEIIRKAITKNGPESPTKVLGDSYKSLAFSYSKTLPDSAIYFYDRASTYYRSVSDTIGLGITLQNIAFCYEEKKNNINEALRYSLQAKEIWEASNDSMNAANIYKYVGYLMGKQKKYTEGKMYIYKAETLFHTLDNSRGIAVCYFDLAMLYKEERQLDSTVVFLLKAKNIWKGYDDSSRIFNINNELLQVYSSMKKRRKAFQVLSENEAILQKDDTLPILYKEKFELLKH